MKTTRFSVTFLLLCTLASSAFAALSKEYADFAKGPVDLLLTKAERKAWSSIRNDADAKKFIDLFWARRDPTPGTPANEFRDGVHQRIELADGRFHTAKLAGSLTDRGKTFILLGSPTSQRRGGNPAGGTVQSPTGAMPTAPIAGNSLQEYGSREMWIYEQAKMPNLNIGQPIAEVGFLDQYSSNEWKRERVAGTEYARLFEHVANSFITQPALTEVPTFTAAPVAAPVAPVVVEQPQSLTAFKTDALRVAVEQARKAKTSSETLYVTYGEFITGEGTHFVPVQLYATKASGLAADTPVTFFGQLEKAEGGDVILFEEPATLTASGDAVVYGKSLTLAPGSYQGTFGLARDGQPVAIVSTPVTVQGLTKEGPSISQLILSSNVYPMTEAQAPTDPYAFGGLKVVPKGDGAFRKSEELWYFVETRNPGIDPATSLPNMTIKVTIEGKTKEGRNVRMAGAAEQAQAIEIKGVTGHYGLGQAIPLETFKPGNYTFTLQVKDKVLDKTYDFKEAFRVIE